MKGELRKYIIQLALLMTTCMIVGFIALEIAQYYFFLYPCIAVFFFLLGFVSIFLMRNSETKENRKYFNAFMVVRMIKLFSLIIAVALYIVYAVFAGERKENIIIFLLIFFAYYLIYSVFEAYVSMKLNKNENEISQK